MPVFDTPLTHSQKIAAARGLAMKRLPYFAKALFMLMPKPHPGLMSKVGAGMGVTARGLLVYDPDVVQNEWDLEDVEFGLLHEIGHLLRDHAKRCEEYGYDRSLWNKAGDAAINDDLVAAGCKHLKSDMMPESIQDPATGKPMAQGLTEEAYYDALRKQAKGGGDGDGDKGRPGAGNCGGIAGNPFDIDEDGTFSETQGQPGGRSDVDIERVKRAVAADIQQHEQKHGRGSVPGGWSVWAHATLKPAKVRWQDKLKRVVRGGVARVRGMTDFAYDRPSRRQAGLGYGKGIPILPAMYAPTPRVGVFVDTSGSMGPQDLADAMSEVDGVLKACGGEVLLGVCDATVHGKIETVKDVRQACAKLKGGGGTHFTPVFEELMRMPPSKRPHIVIMATDGGGPAPALPPDGMTVIWVLVGGHAVIPWVDKGRGGSIAWGEHIFVKDQ